MLRLPHVLHEDTSHEGWCIKDAGQLYLCLAHLIIRRLEEVSCDMRPQKEGNTFVQHWHCEDLAMLVVSISHQIHWALQQNWSFCSGTVRPLPGW